MISPSPLLSDAHDTIAAIRAGRSSPAQEMQRCLNQAQSPVCASTFRSLNPLALAQAAVVSPDLPLAGLAVSVKDLFDVAGEVSASGSTVMAGNAPALQDSVAVARLKAAGGVVIGRTHMVEFAFSGMGVNPHFGTPVNPLALAADPGTPRIPGGSSSGAAVSVASGAAFVGLGSDTGGSIRIPAALCGLVGFKPTARAVPTQGAVPLSHTLDSIGALTRSVRDATLAHEILSGQTIPAQGKALRDCHFAVAQSNMLDALDADVARNFDASLKAIRDAGATITPIALTEIADLGSIQARGGFSAPEIQSWLIPAGLWPDCKAEFDPRVAQRIAMADAMSAADYVRLQLARQQWIERVNIVLQGFDGVLSPTVPLVAAPIADVAPGVARDAEFFRVNALMLRNTSVVNLLDGCAISLPNQPKGSLPTGLMLWHGAGLDARILSLAAPIEARLRLLTD
ncbi:amidase [Variovorax sp. PCZ-1]|uniref:amidase n=1 Tax=Variovorax sp. PCZ-1 TaxID=2835533 RepID=UPI001BCC2F11|nr:amidase [Variovorax sp. PCZ-1]MBS7806478.1 amidase [Variovorax sp. PCZ-1]